MPELKLEEIVALCKRRGFVFPSSEIYGGLGSTYDYGHYGVLTKNNIRSLWFRAMVQERDDIVALDSAIILNPSVWEASGHVAGFTDPLVDCRECKARFRADHIADAQCPLKPSKAPGQHFTNFSRAGAIIGSDKRHVQPGLLKDLCIELVIDVNHKNTRILSSFQHGDQSFGIGRSDDDGINSPRDHLLHQIHLLSKIRFIFDAVDD